MGVITQQQIEAAQEFANATIDTLETGSGAHAETAIAGTARMAGTFLFRSFNFSLDDVKAGQPVLSVEANEQGPQLMQIVEIVLDNLGIKINEEEMIKAQDTQNEPLLNFLETQKQLEPKYTEIRNRFGLSLQEAAQSAAVASAMLIQHAAQVLDPNVAFGIAVYGIIKGTKTVPETITQ